MVLNGDTLCGNLVFDGVFMHNSAMMQSDLKGWLKW